MDTPCEDENKTGSTRKEFDVLLGGEISLPLSVSVRDFVNSRINEIEALAEAIENPQRTAMIFQQLPKRMRRRVMSHNAKRMPNRLKQSHSQLLKKCGAKEVGKRPSRKYRRRPKNLRDDYVRRQRNNVWLETHIWHAKRFHMINTWGYRLANFPNDKSFRACYRASSQHCFLQDISFTSCIEIVGPFEKITSGLSHLSSNSFTKKPQLAGKREGTALITHPDSKPIGEVSYIWGPFNIEEGTRHLWLWAHPAFYSELIEQLASVFESTEVSVTSLKDQLNRFRLIGPKSIEVIAGGLKAVKGDELCSWSADYYSTDDKLDCFKVQADYYRRFSVTQNPGQLPPRSILPATVTLTMPKLPYQMREREVDINEVIENPVESVDSPLWSDECRKAMRKANDEAKERLKMTDRLVPGLEQSEDTTPVSVLLVHRPGRDNNHRGYGCGLDLICPGGWGMRIWLSLVHHGGRVGGLRESGIVEADTTLKPIFPLDSDSYRQHELNKNSEARVKHFRLPPAKRPNFQKLGVCDPFEHPWLRLKEDWDSSELIRVSVTSEGKLGPGSQICLPHESDIENRSSLPHEPRHADSTKQQRDELKKRHKLVLRKLAKNRKKLRLKDTDKSDIAPSTPIIEQHKKTIEKLWLGETTTPVRNRCIRETMGFVTDGGFSFLHGKCSGFGYITKSSLEALGKVTPKNTVLTRTTTSYKYRLATVTPT